MYGYSSLKLFNTTLLRMLVCIEPQCNFHSSKINISNGFVVAKYDHFMLVEEI